MPSEWGYSNWKDLFLNVYHPWGNLIGIWQADSQPFGGVLQVKCQPPKLVASSLVTASTNQDCKLDAVPVFEICGAQSRISCLRSGIIPWGQTQGQGINVDVAKIHRASVMSLSKSEFRLTCSEECHHDSFERRNRKDCIIKHIINSSSAEARERIQSYYFHYLHEAITFDLWHAQLSTESNLKSNCVNYKRLQTVKETNHDLEGFWKSSYGPHGIEFIEVVQEGRYLIGYKVTGDPNVWAGKITFKAHLDDSVTDETSAEGEHRFKAQGQIAEFGYQNPAWTPAELIFNTNVWPQSFAVLWPEISSVLTFYRLDIST